MAEEEPMADRNIAAFGLHAVEPQNLADNKKMSAIQQAGWTTVIVGLFHIDAAGNLYVNDTKIIENGEYIGSSDWPDQLQQLVSGPGSKVKTLEASIGGWAVDDFKNIKAIYEHNGNSFDRTLLKTNFQKFHDKFLVIRLIDMDTEDTYDSFSFVAFCMMLIKMGFGITFCPYSWSEKDFWVGSLKALNLSANGAVQWWNLQCYAGGDGNDPKAWAEAINAIMPEFDTTGFILGSDWSRFLNRPKEDPRTWYWEGHCPPDMQTQIETFAAENCVGGAFLWNIDQILSYADDQKKLPDPAPCRLVAMTDYVAAIKNGLAKSARAGG